MSDDELRKETIQGLEAMLRSILEECQSIMKFIEQLKRENPNWK